MNREQLLRKLTEFDFMTVDLQLFLDTHPCDKAALMNYNYMLTQANNLRSMYESMYGPLTSFRSYSKYPWQWINDPWPWSYEANFRLAGEEE